MVSNLAERDDVEPSSSTAVALNPIGVNSVVSPPPLTLFNALCPSSEESASSKLELSGTLKLAL